jgi:hypothetical protein
MKLISHRGNLNGVDHKYENNPLYIDEALKNDFDVELDLRTFEGNLFLGHDLPTYKIDIDWLLTRSEYLWVHCKDIESMVTLKNSEHGYLLNYFYHDIDDVTLTSKGFFWTYPSKTLTKHSIAVKPEIVNYTPKELSNCYGICSDVIFNYVNYEI